MQKIERILVPIDLSPASKSALEHASFLAKKFNAVLDVLHIADPQKVRGDDDVSILNRGVPGSTMEQYAEQETQDALTEFVKAAGLDRQVRLDEIEESKDAAACIVKVAKEKGYDLIVMGSHGTKHGLARVFSMGSTTQKVVESAPVPVLTCHAK
jgi:nucleotide-binding universal stress UspA family protein